MAALHLLGALDRADQHAARPALLGGQWHERHVVPAATGQPRDLELAEARLLARGADAVEQRADLGRLGERRRVRAPEQRPVVGQHPERPLVDQPVDVVGAPRHRDAGGRVLDDLLQQHALACQGALQRDRRRDLAARPDPFAHGSVALEHRHAARREVPRRAVGAEHAVLDLVRPPGRDGPAPGPPHATPVVGMHRVEPPVAEHLFGGLSGDRAPRREVLLDAPVGRRRPHHLRGGLDKRAVPLLAAAEREHGVVDGAHRAGG